jgi:hypothetical protein
LACLALLPRHAPPECPAARQGDDDGDDVEVAARKRFSVAPKLVMTVFPLGPSR